MDNVTAKSIANQKVFVPLTAVLEVQENFNRLHPNGVMPSVATQNYLRGLAYAIKTLGLPVNFPNGY